MNKFRREEDFSAPLSEINTTPLVDVMLVLLVVFLVTAPMLNNSIELNLPKESAKEISQNDKIVISIKKSGQYYIEEEKVGDDELVNILEKIAKNHPKKQIHIRADIEVKYGKVSKVLATAQRLGLSNVGFVTQK
jgi:biopolymer transport protein ExbD